MIPVAWDALVVIVRKDNTIDSIFLDQLKRLYLGKIQNWLELGEEPAHRPADQRRQYFRRRM